MGIKYRIMTDKREFKINLGAADAEDEFVPAPRERKKTEKPQSVRYAPSLAVLFALMALGLSLVWMYYHFSSRLEALNTEGSSGIASLSSEFTDKITSMSQELTDQKKAAQALLVEIENQVAKLKTSVALLKTEKADAKDMETAVSGIKKNISPLQGSLANLEGQIIEINRKAETAEARLKQIEANVSKNTSQLATFNENRIDKGYIDQEIKKEKESQERKLAASAESLLRQIASLETKISNMKQRLVTMENQLSRKSSVPARTPSSTYQTPASVPARSPAGEIIEQDIN